MSYSSTDTYTYTIADVQKVMDQVRADTRMAAESSETMTQSEVDSYLADVAEYAKRDYLTEILIYLKDARGETTQAAEYEISTDAGSFTATRPGNMLWPRTPGGSLSILLTTNANYDKITSNARDNFFKILRNTWGASSRPSLAHLSGTTDRTYKSNAYGVTKTTYR